ncbi:MAG: PKD domain-containing protein, partial [bacterium]
IDVSITHPFPGLTQYNGYDVRGVFMGDGSESLQYNGDLVYPIFGTDQFMFADPDMPSGDNGAPDGYTRWFNFPEFANPAMPMFGYIPGKAAHPSFQGTATLNPYKYFADGLGVDDDLFTWLENNPETHGVFSAGSTNTRNYYLRFPKAKGVVYGYAITANWGGEEPEFHPSNTPEAIGINTDITDSIYYAGPSDKGGNLILDLDVWNWGVESTAVGDYSIIIESTVLSSPQTVSGSPTGGNENYSTWHVDIPADNINGTDGNEFWVIVEYPNYDYTNDFGVTNDAWDDSLAAFFRYDLYVSSSTENQKPVCDLQVVTDLPAEGWDAGTPVEFDASGSYDPDPGDVLTFHWDFDGDGIYDEDPDDSFKGAPENPTHYFTADYNDKIYLKLTDGMGGETICSVDCEVITHQSKNIQLDSTYIARDIAIDPTNGDLIVILSDGVNGSGNPADQTWRYSREEYYQSRSKMYDLYWGSPDGYAIDMGPDQVSVLASIHIAGVYNVQIWDNAGTMLLCFQQGGPATPNLDVFAMCAGDFAEDVGNILAWPDNNATFANRCPKDDYFYGICWHYYWPTVYTGIDQLYWDWIVSVESDGTDNCIWYLEDDPEFYVARWRLSNSGFPYSQNYDNAYFGTGSQTDADNGWFSSRDITRDDQNRLFILDELSSGEPRVKMWTVDGNNTTSKGGFGDSTSIAGEPLKIEGSDWSGEVVVMHGDGVPYMASVFIPYEMPE